MQISVRRVVPSDAEWVLARMQDEWGSAFVARKGELIDATRLPGFVAALDDDRVGLAVVAMREDEYEVVSISATPEGRGVGRALLQHCFDDARSKGCRRVWLTTTNNNVRAIAFYQRSGMDLCAFYRHGVESARRLKPTIPLRDGSGVAIAHELEFEFVLGDD